MKKLEKAPIPLENNYEKHYSESSFWDKIKSVAVKAGYELINKALQLYYAMQSPSMPAKDKAIVIAVLGYFILPVDVVPDFIPALGFADDLAALAWALKTISSNITPEVKEKAQQRCDNLFLE
jgi:uncharacterized membrane protein YkvA (DUF1232 family)